MACISSHYFETVAWLDHAISNRAPFIDVSGGSEAQSSSRSIEVGKIKIEELKARPSSRLIEVGEAKMCTNEYKCVQMYLDE